MRDGHPASRKALPKGAAAARERRLGCSAVSTALLSTSVQIDRARGRAHVTLASPHSDARDDARCHAPLPPFEVAGRIRAFSGFLRNFLDRAQGGLNPRLSALGASFGRLGPLDTPPATKYQVIGAGHLATSGAITVLAVKGCPANIRLR